MNLNGGTEAVRQDPGDYRIAPDSLLPGESRDERSTRAPLEDDVDASTGTIGLALSGGGVRAALFSLGVLLYLVQSRHNRRIAMVTSVSGGSITNAAVAAAGDLSEMTPESFAPVCCRLARRLTKHGSFFMPSRKAWFLYGVVLLLSLTALNAWGEWNYGNRPSIATLAGRSLPSAAVTSALLVLQVLIQTLFFRRRTQRDVYKRIISAMTADHRSAVRRAFQLDAISTLPPSNVQHVICATELTSGQPIFLSRNWVYSRTYGWGLPKVSPDRAVYASAAFPAAFPPLRLSTRRLEMGGGQYNRNRPKTLLLADGGVYNNLGTDWFTFAKEAADIPWGFDPRFGEYQPPEVDYQIIVNASSPASVARIPRLWPLRSILSFARIMTVLYENTLRPRLEQLERESSKRTAVIDISKSPIQLAQQALRGVESDSDACKRAEVLCERLRALSSEYWTDLVEDTSLLKTTLTAVGEERGARLMRHGYISAMAAMHVRFGRSGLDDVPDERTFIGLTRQSRRFRTRWWT